MEVSLQEWFEDNTPSATNLYVNGFYSQINFIRDAIPHIFAKDYDEYRKIRDETKVISTHSSKSLLLPIVRLVLPCGITLTLGNNIRNWKLSVDSPYDIKADFLKIYDQQKDHTDFMGNFVYGYYSKNKRQFTVALPNDYHLFTFLWVLAHAKRRTKKK